MQMRHYSTVSELKKLQGITSRTIAWQIDAKHIFVGDQWQKLNLAELLEEIAQEDRATGAKLDEQTERKEVQANYLR